MSRVDEMHELVNELAGAHADRRETLTALRSAVQQQRADCTAERAAMSTKLRADLASVHTMLADFTAERAALSQEDQAARHRVVTEMVAHTQSLLDQFAAANRAVAAKMRETLTADRTDLVTDTRALLSQFAAANRQAATDLHAFLSADRQARSAAAADLHAVLSADQQARSAAMASFLADTTAGRRAMAEALADRLEHFKAALQADVASERSELRRSLSEMAKVWREFAAAMRGGAGQEQPASPAPATAQPAAEGEDVTSDILNFLAEHPEGAKLVDLAPMFELARPQLGRLLRDLVDSGKVVKDPETLVYKLA